MARRTSDVVIVGGGVMGSAVAFFLRAGRFLTLDLSPLTPGRFATGALLLEEAVI